MSQEFKTLPTPDLSGRVALVTGASRGIGYATALELAKCGAHVIAIARTVGGLEELDDAIQKDGNGQATLMPIDLLDTESLEPLGPTIAERFGRLNILVANAGLLGTLGPIAHSDPKEWDKVLKLNLTTNQRLIRTLDPLLRGSDAGRALFVTSSVGQTPRAFWNAYAVSKAGLDMMVQIYAEETAQTPLKANLLNPGATRTGMRASAFPGEDPETLKAPEEIAPDIVKMVSPDLDVSGQIFSL